MMRRYVAITAIVACAAACSRNPDGAAANPKPQAPEGSAQLAIKRFASDIYGGSGVAQLPDGRVLVVEDQESHPLVLVDLFGTGTIKSFTPREVTLALQSHGTSALRDLEGAASDPRGHVYAATSHSPTKVGKERQEREQLVRFDIAGDRLANMQVSLRLKPALEILDPVFASPDHGGMNIEGLAWDPEHSRLLIGFRSPRRNKDALLVWLQNPDMVFAQAAEPSLLPAVNLDLKGEGVRDVAYSPTLRGFVIVAGTWKSKKHAPPTLWFWKGDADAPILLQAPGLDDLKPEGIAEVVFAGRRGLLIVSDDGSGDDLYYKGRSIDNCGVPDRYAILPFDQLLRDNPSLKNLHYR